MKCKRDSDGRKLDHVSLQTMRNQAVKAVRNGQTAQSVADAYGLNIRTVFRWLAAYASGGQKALQAKPIPGRPSKLTGEQMSWLAGAVRSHTPQQYKFEFALWTLGLISDLIERRFAVSLSRSAAGRVMRTLGFTPQRPPVSCLAARRGPGRALAAGGIPPHRRRGQACWRDHPVCR